jgi:hypothetical protein
MGPVPKWPLRVALSLLLAVEVLFVVLLSAEGVAENSAMIINSVGLIVFCVLAWRGVTWGRWLLIALLVWRVAGMVFSAVSHFGPGDHRLGGTLVLAGFYVVLGLVFASPLGRPRMRAVT